MSLVSGSVIILFVDQHRCHFVFLSLKYPSGSEFLSHFRDNNSPSLGLEVV